MLSWLAVVSVSLSWIFAVHLYVTENPLVKWILIGAGLAAAAADAREKTRLPRKFLWLLPLLAVSWFIAPPPYRAPFLLCAAGVLLSATAEYFDFQDVFSRVGGAALRLGAILIVQVPVFWLVAAWTARNPDIPFAAPALYALLKWVGADVTLGGGRLFIRTMQTVHEFPLTWGHFALFPLLTIWVGGILALWWNRARSGFLNRAAAFSYLLILYAVLRLFLVLSLFITAMLFEEYGSETVHVELFWLPWVTALTFAPLVPLLGRFLPFGDPGEEEKARGGRKKSYGQAAVLAACTFCVGLAVGLRFPDPGIPKGGRILLDEAHSLWERSDKPYDTDWYGSESEYNYWCMAEYLKYFYRFERNLEGPITPEKLAHCDILILKNPTRPYRKEEIEAIEEFVRSGGGLFLLGEHTDVFGTSSCINAVARRFGVAFRPDVVFDIERKWEQVFFPPKLGVHPIVRRIPFFRFAVTCSIETTSLRARPVMRSTGLWTLPNDYTAGNFYPQVKDHTYARFGAFDQMVSVTAGKGRVAAFGDSTVYSNFLALSPGKAELLLAAMERLNRKNSLDWIRILGFLLSAAGLLVLLRISALRPHRLGLSVGVVVTSATATLVTLWLFSVAADRFYPPPKPLNPVPRVLFDMEHSGCELPIFGFTQKREESCQVFYQWVLRPGFFPRVAFSLERALKEGQVVVIVKPTRSFSAEERDRVRTFLEAGGRLLVLDSPRNVKSTASELLSPEFGLSVERKPCRGSSIREPGSGTRICSLSLACPVTGGKAFLVTDAGEPVAAWRDVGKGRLVVAGLAERFSDTRMGFSTRRIPDYELRAVYELEFALLRGLVNGNLEEEILRLGRLYSE